MQIPGGQFLYRHGGRFLQGASAFVLLAWMDDKRLESLLAAAALHPVTHATITSKAALRKRLAETAAQGYGVSQGELDEDVLGVAAPIRDALERVVAAVSVAAVARRAPEGRIPALAEAVCATAGEISGMLALLD